MHILLYQPSQDNLSDSPTKNTFTIECTTPNLPKEIQIVLQTHSSIFQNPKGLPPSRFHDHHLPLELNSAPINVKPYKYPHSQKEAMTTIIKYML